ncbi:putative G-protein coupled receptor 25 [Gastrophryne carolinensis]
MTTEIPTMTDFYYDYENECPSEDMPHIGWVVSTLYLLFFLVGLTGNVVVIMVLSTRSSRRADTFILNLAISDLIFVLNLPFWVPSQVQEDNWPFGDFLCRASSFALAVTRSTSCFLMAIMSVDRYLAVIKQNKAHPLRARSCSIGACCGIWLVSILLGCPSLVSRHISETNSCIDSNESIVLDFKIAISFLTFVVPFVVVTFCYCRMARYLCSHFASQLNVLKSRGRSRRGHSWLRIVSCIVGFYCFSWLPFNTVNTLVMVMTKCDTMVDCSTKEAIQQARRVSTALAFVNSCTNPLIYALLDSGFRRQAKLSVPRALSFCRSLLPISGSTAPSTSGSIESTSIYTSDR